MNPLSSALLVAGGVLAIVSGLGLLRLRTPYARLHAAGKASPFAFLLAGTGAAIELGGAGAAQLVVAMVGMIVTIPVGVHLLFRAVHRTGDNRHLHVDELSTSSGGDEDVVTDL